MDQLGVERGHGWNGPLTARQLVLVLAVVGLIVAGVVFIPKAVHSQQRADAQQQRAVQQLDEAICTPPIAPANATFCSSH